LEKHYLEVSAFLENVSPKALMAAIGVLVKITETADKDVIDKHYNKINETFNDWADRFYIWWIEHGEYIYSQTQNTSGYKLLNDNLTNCKLDDIRQLSPKHRGFLIQAMEVILNDVADPPVQSQENQFVQSILNFIRRLDRVPGDVPLASPKI